MICLAILPVGKVKFSVIFLCRINNRPTEPYGFSLLKAISRASQTAKRGKMFICKNRAAERNQACLSAVLRILTYRFA